MNAEPLVSVVIPSYNEETYIERLLDALLKQKYENFEVIVSDAQSKDKTAEIIKGYQSKLRLKFVQTPPAGPGAGRNAGTAIASGEWLLFLDADVDIDDPYFISTILNESIKHHWQTATAKVALKNATLVERAVTRLNYNYTKLLAHTKHPVAPGWCILTKRALFEANQGFNIKIQFGEDYDYVSRVGAAGFGFIEATYFYMDLRRAHAEGWRFVYKGFANEVYRYTHGYNLEKSPVVYEFGKHKSRK